MARNRALLLGQGFMLIVSPKDIFAAYHVSSLGKPLVRRRRTLFFELRQYRTKPGQRENWVKFMEEVIIPFQASRGMVVTGSFTGQEEDDLYVWIRRFSNEEEKESQYRAVYDSDTWQNEISPRVREMLDTTKTHITRLEATSKSLMQ